MGITEITMCAIRDFSRLPIDSALISSPARRNGGGGGGGGWRRSITSRFISVVLRGPLFPRIRNCEMIVGLVADNLVARFSCGSLRFSPLVHRPPPPPPPPWSTAFLLLSRGSRDFSWKFGGRRVSWTGIFARKRLVSMSFGIGEGGCRWCFFNSCENAWI